MNENELIPYEAAEVAAERLLVLAAHPDDEVFGAGGLMARIARGSEAVRVVVFTGGDAQEETGGGSADPATRSREAREAGEILGVSDYVFLDFADRSLAANPAAVGEAIAGQIADFQPDLVLSPSPCEIHPDHRALAERLYSWASGRRPADAGYPAIQRLRLLFYEITQPILPNVLVPLRELALLKQEAAAKFVSQAAVRDYAGAVEGLNRFRSLTLSDAGPVEAFRVIELREAMTHSLEEFRRAIGPGVIVSGASSPVPVGVVVRTKNRPELLLAALQSLADQTCRPRQVVVVNDGGGALRDLSARWHGAFALTVAENEKSAGRAAAANQGAGLVTEEGLAFLDDDDILLPAHFQELTAARRTGPEPVVYSDAVTVMMEQDGLRWTEKHRELQYSMDFDPDLLLWSNYIPLHTVLMDRGLFGKVGGFDPALDYSEDWDLWIRLSLETSFRHVRAVTAQYRVFSQEAGHAAAASLPFQEARRTILARYASRRTELATAAILDRLTARIFDLSCRDYAATGELSYQRTSQRRLTAGARQLRHALGEAEAQARRLGDEAQQWQDEAQRRQGEGEGLRSELAVARGEVERISGETGRLHAEIARLTDLVSRMEGTRAWRFHQLVQSFKRGG